eukprot:391750-Rhodomonas_salina.1
MSAREPPSGGKCVSVSEKRLSVGHAEEGGPASWVRPCTSSQRGDSRIFALDPYLEQQRRGAEEADHT